MNSIPLACQLLDLTSRDGPEVDAGCHLPGKARVNYFDIGNDAFKESSRTTLLTLQQRSELEVSFRRIAGAQDRGELGRMRLRPSREHVQKVLAPRADKCYAALFKAVVDPYGDLWACCMRAHPILQHAAFRLGNLRTGDDFQRFVDENHKLPVPRRAIPLPFHCSECTEYEYVSNICTEKLLDDMEFGISLSQHPYVPACLIGGDRVN